MIEPQVAISSCLLGERVRFDGSHNVQPLIVDKLQPYFSVIPVCPEVACGLSIPRPPLELISQQGVLRIQEKDSPSNNVTPVMKRESNMFFEKHSLMAGAIMQSKSPTCGVTDTAIFSTKTNSTRYNSGYFVQQLRQVRPFVPVIDEKLITHQDYRYRFFTHSFALAKIYDALKTNRIAPVTEFHRQYQFLLMAFSKKKYDRLTEVYELWKKRRATHMQYLNCLADNLRAPFAAKRFLWAIDCFAHFQPSEKKSKLRLVTRLLSETDADNWYVALFTQHLWTALEEFNVTEYDDNPLFCPFPKDLLTVMPLKKKR